MRLVDTIIWRTNSIPTDVQRALRMGLTEARLPEVYATEELGEAWEGFKRAYVNLERLDPRVTTPGTTTWPNTITEKARARASDLLTIYLIAPSGSRAELLRALRIEAEQTVSDEKIQELVKGQGETAARVTSTDAKPKKRRR